LKDSFVLDNRGFTVTGPDLAGFAGRDQWPLMRSPFLLETSNPGIFAVGDTQAGSVKWVTCGVALLGLSPANCTNPFEDA
jgi:thioredoxin reductase (NADPH)